MDKSDVEAEGSELAAPFKEIGDALPNTPVAPAHGIAAIALSMAMKYHDMSMVKDGVLYQQYKLEGVNIRTIGLADVFETAIKIERHLLQSSERIASIVVDALEASIDEHEADAEKPMSAPNAP